MMAKWLISGIVLLVGGMLWPASLIAEDSEPRAYPFADFEDPRRIPLVYEWIVDGEESEDLRLMADSVLIICWMPPPVELPGGEFEAYQISGLDGYHDQAQVERFLDALYAMEHPPEASQGNIEKLNVLVAGNNWGAGIQLKEKLKQLSKAQSFSVFYAGGWAFQKANLIEEPEARLKLIQEAYEGAAKREQKSSEHEK